MGICSSVKELCRIGPCLQATSPGVLRPDAKLGAFCHPARSKNPGDEPLLWTSRSEGWGMGVHGIILALDAPLRQPQFLKQEMSPFAHDNVPVELLPTRMRERCGTALQ